MTTPYANTAVKTAQVNLLAATTTKLGTGAAGVALASRILIRVRNNSATDTLYLGDNAAAPGTGWAVGPNDETDWLPMGQNIDLFGYLAGGGVVTVMELS